MKHGGQLFAEGRGMSSGDEQLEIEMKFPLADFRLLQTKLRDRKARRVQLRALHEEDHYFNAPDRDFAQTDEALRLRRIGSANFVTYKGPKRDLQTKTRTEIEVPIKSGKSAAEDFSRLLRNLGYKDVAVVRKDRWLFRLANEQGFAVEICLDEVADLGKFAELEILAPASKLEAARSVLLSLATELGLAGSERRSYLEMLLSRSAKL
jgi:adenylate cyclase class 2